MKSKTLLFAAWLLGSAVAVAQEVPPGGPVKQAATIGREMSLITPGLMQAAFDTNFFLRLTGEIQLARQQRAALEEIAYEFRKQNVQNLAELKVVDAELELLLTRDSIDLEAVRAKIDESESIVSNMRFRRIQASLKSVNLLTHEQHLKIIVMILELQKPGDQPEFSRLHPGTTT